MAACNLPVPKRALRCVRILPALVLSVPLWLTGCGSTRAPEDALPTPRPQTEREAPAVALDPRYAEEIEELADRPAVREALRHIEATDERTVRQQIRLSELPAPPFAEQERARLFLEMLREAGVDSAFIDDEGNVIGIRRGTGGDETLVLSGHLDTVFPEGTDVSVEVRGDTLIGPGIGDDARGLAAVLAVLRAMNEAELETRGDVWFVGTVGEEGLGDLRGVKHLFEAYGDEIDGFISIDGSGETRVTHQALGSRRYRATVRGPGGHSWGAFGTANPAHALGRAIQLFDDRAAEFVASGPRTSYNVGRIGGGTSINSVPFEAWMEVDMRSVDVDRLAAIDALFRRTVREAVAVENQGRTRGDSLVVELDLVGDRPSGETPATAPLIQRSRAAIRHFGFEPRLGRSSTDANTPISLGYPALTLGGGGTGHGAHSLAEYWVNDDGHVAIQRTLLVVLAQVGLR